MLGKDLINEAIDRLQKDRNDKIIRERVKAVLNSSYQIVCDAYHWKSLLKRQEITVIPNITDGNCTITKGSKTVSFSGVTLTSNMVGRFFKHANGGTWYQIRYIDTVNNQVILHSDIIEDSASNINYKIWKKYYTLNSNVRQIWDYNNVTASENFMQNRFGSRNESYRPYPFKESGTDEYTVTYNTGTITLAKNSNVASGTGTAFLNNVTPGAILTLEATDFRVKRIESDTRMILLNYSDKDISGSYTIIEDNPRQIEMLFGVQDNSNSNARNIIIPIDYLSNVYPIVYEDYDRLEVQYHFRESILRFTEARFFDDKDDPRGTNNSSHVKAQAVLNALKSNKDLVAASYFQFAPYIVSGFGRGE